VLDRGKIVAHGSPRDLIDAHVTREVLELRFPVGEQESSARTIRNGTFRSGASIGARVERCPTASSSTPMTARPALAAIHATSLSPLTALVRRASLEDVFLELTGRSLIE